MGGLNVGGKKLGVRNAELERNSAGVLGLVFGRCDLGGRLGMRVAVGNYGEVAKVGEK